MGALVHSSMNWFWFTRRACGALSLEQAAAPFSVPSLILIRSVLWPRILSFLHLLDLPTFTICKNDWFFRGSTFFRKGTKFQKIKTRLF